MSSAQAPRRYSGPWWLGPLIAVLYVGTGKLSLLLALPPGYASAIFPPAGIALGFAFIRSVRVLPWIGLGSLLLNLWVAGAPGRPLEPAGVEAAVAIALASTLQAAVGAWWLRRAVGYPTRFDRAREILVYLASAPVVCLISATLSVSALVAMSVIEANSFWLHWLAWWLGDTLGALVFVPLVLLAAGEPRDYWRERRVAIAGPLALAFALCVLVFTRTSAWEQEQSLRDFQLRSTEVADRIQTGFDEQELVVGQVAAFMGHDKSEAVTAAEFARFVGNFIARFPMVQAVEWAPQVADAQRKSFEAQVRLQVPEFAIRDTAARGAAADAGARPLHFPILYAAPRQGNETVIGFDIASTPERRDFVARCLESDAPVATAPLHLIQDGGAHPGILLLQHAARGAGAGGIALTVVRADQFVGSMLTADRASLEVRLLDVASGDVLYDSRPSAERRLEGGFERLLTFGGRRFLLRTDPSPAYLLQHRGQESFGLLVAGLFGTGLLGAFLMLGTGYAARIRRTVAERTDELARESEKRRLLLRNSSDGLHILDARGNVVEASDAFCGMLGYAREEIVGMNVAQWDARPNLAQLQASLPVSLETHVARHFEVVHRRKDGSCFDAEVSIVGISLDGERLLFCSSRDITERKAAERRVRESEARFRGLFENAPIGKAIAAVDDGRVLEANPTLCGFLGYSSEEIKGLSLSVLSHPDDLEASLDGRRRLLEGRAKTYVVEKRYRHKDGRFVWGQATATLVRDDAGRPSYLIVQIENIERRKAQEAELEDARRRLALALEASDLSIFDFDIRRGIVLLDEQWAKMMGMPPGATHTTAQELAERTHPEDIERARQAFLALLRGTAAEYNQESRVRTADGGWKWIRCSGKVVERDAAGRAWRFIGTNLDVTARRSAEERIRELAFFDSMTNLPNRALFLDRLQQAVAVSQRGRRPLSVLYLDLNRFKEINDARGHDVGDRVLREVAQRFARIARESDTLGRLGGDEFAIVAPNTSAADALVLAERILASLEAEIAVAGEAFKVGVSVGVAAHPEDGATPEELLRSADASMYRAKASGRQAATQDSA